MKRFFFFLLSFSGFVASAQTLAIQTNTSKFLRQGDHIEFQTNISNHSNKEITGQVQLELINPATNQSVDGWFLNTFPNQYFTIAANSKEQAKFPVQVPYDFKGKLYVRVTARIDSESTKHLDSLQIDSLIKSDNPSNKSIQLSKQLFVWKTINKKPVLIPIEKTTIRLNDTIYTELHIKTTKNLNGVTIDDYYPATLLPFAKKPNEKSIHSYQVLNQSNGITSFTVNKLSKGSYTFSYFAVATRLGTFSQGSTMIKADGRQSNSYNKESTVTVE